MSRPTQLIIEPQALLHNLRRIKQLAPGKQVFAMVKANAYGCSIKSVIPVLEGNVDAFGVACLEEALAIRALGALTECILLEGVFNSEELVLASTHEFSCVIHQANQLRWLINTPLPKPMKIWVKVNTGMNRLGFKVEELEDVMSALKTCLWVDKDIGLMTQMACADKPDKIENQQQISLFQGISIKGFAKRSIANSATIVSFPNAQEDSVRPGIMLYGVSPFSERTSLELGLIPVMRFISSIVAIHHLPPFSQVGYGGTWQSENPSIIGIVAAGYGDGYPRHIKENTPVWIKDKEVPIVGRVSMDLMSVDLTRHPEVRIGEPVELWGTHILVERVAQSAGTIPYELLCQMTERVRL